MLCCVILWIIILLFLSDIVLPFFFVSSWSMELLYDRNCPSSGRHQDNISRLLLLPFLLASSTSSFFLPPLLLSSSSSSSSFFNLIDDDINIWRSPSQTAQTYFVYKLELRLISCKFQLSAKRCSVSLLWWTLFHGKMDYPVVQISWRLVLRDMEYFWWRAFKIKAALKCQAILCWHVDLSETQFISHNVVDNVNLLSVEEIFNCHIQY